MNDSIFKVKKSVIYLYLSLLFCFEPKIAVKYSIFNYSFILGAVVVFTFTALKYFKTQKISKMFIALVLFRASFFFQTVFNSGDIMMWGYMSIVLMNLCMIFDMYLKKKKYLLMNCIINIFTVFLLINFLISLVYPNGIVDGIFFIGIRTRISDVIFPLLAFTLINDSILLKKHISKQTIIAISVSLLNIIRFSVTTAIIGIALLFMCYFLFIRYKKMRRVLNLRLIVYTGVLISFLFTFFGVYSYFSNFIVNVLHKDASLSSRTLIWAEAIKYIYSSPVFGHGLAVNGNFVYWGYIGGIKELWQAHNNWLQLLYDGGVVSLLIFLRMINMNSEKIKQFRDEKTTSILLITLAVFLVMMISEIFIYTPYFYILIFCFANMEYLVQGGINYEKG